MAEIKQQSGNQVLDYMARDYDSLLDAMRKQIPEKIPEWTDYQSEADFGNALLELFAHMGDIISYYQDRIANESFLGTAIERRSIIQHLKLIGYSLSTAAPSSAELVISLPVETTGEFRLRRGDAFSTRSSKEKPSVRFEYNGKDRDISLDDFTVDLNDVTQKNFFIPVEEGTLIKDDIIGISNGGANQRFVLNHTPLILRSFGNGGQTQQDISVITELGGDIQVWKRQESLAFSLEGQNDYAIEVDESDQATIIFGDNKFGAIPSTGSVIKVTYRVGGGLKGNVSAGSISSVSDAPALALLGANVTNRESATGGSERENIEHAVMHAPYVYRSFQRAVTAEDYKSLAVKFKGVGKVRSEARNWNTVILYVAPDGGGLVSDVLRANLIAYFEDKRSLSTIIEVDNVEYVKIFITAEISVKSYYSQENVRTQVADAVSFLLSFDQVDFAQKIYLSKFYEAIEDIEGVEYVTIKDFHREGDPGPNDDSGKIELRQNEVPRAPTEIDDDPDYSDGLKIEISGGYV